MHSTRAFLIQKKEPYILVPFQWILLGNSEDVDFSELDHLKKGLVSSCSDR